MNPLYKGIRRSHTAPGTSSVLTKSELFSAIASICGITSTELQTDNIKIPLNLPARTRVPYTIPPSSRRKYPGVTWSTPEAGTSWTCPRCLRLTIVSAGTVFDFDKCSLLGQEWLLYTASPVEIRSSFPPHYNTSFSPLHPAYRLKQQHPPECREENVVLLTKIGNLNFKLVKSNSDEADRQEVQKVFLIRTLKKQ
jgi:hypothetical protein